MINTAILKVIVFIFKIYYYQFGVDYAVVDVIAGNEFAMAYEYEQNSETLVITPHYDGAPQPNQAIVVSTIDNALYKLRLPGEKRALTLDLAPLYSALDWENLAIDYKEFEDEDGGYYYLSQGAENIYLSSRDDDWFFVLSRKYLPGESLK